MNFYSIHNAIFSFLLSCYCSAFSQINLIPNPSFENYDSIPYNFDQLKFCNNWYRTFGTADYFSAFSPTACSSNSYGIAKIPLNAAGFQQSKSGNFYAGLLNFGDLPASSGWPPFSMSFESIGAQLNQPLLSNHVYNFSLNYSLANFSGLVNNNFSALFTASQYSLNTGLFNPLSQSWYDFSINNMNPQVNFDTTAYLSTDTLNWTLFNQCFLANGGEKYMTIGNFRDKRYNKVQPVTSVYSAPCNSVSGSPYCYLYIDDVSLYDLGFYSGAVKCKNDTLICVGATISIGNNIKDSALISWQPTIALSCTNCPNPIVTPSVTTKYLVTKSLCSFVTKDSITITVYTPTLSANAGYYKDICPNDTLTLGTNDSTFYTSYLWQPTTGLSCTNCPQPVASPFTTTTYTLSRTECSFNTKDTVTITVDDCEIKIPDIFTPNNDNVNDEWKIKLPGGFKLKAVAVYDRWGTLIYDIDDAILNSENSKIRVARWDGRTISGLECSDGAYFYILHYTDKSGELQKRKGNITLIR
jgi:gliding motility-associated-like protein